MSIKTFSQEVKDELCEVKLTVEEARAELAAMILFGENTSNFDSELFKTNVTNIISSLGDSINNVYLSNPELYNTKKKNYVGLIVFIIVLIVIEFMFILI